jgi:hypothetical protein
VESDFIQSLESGKFLKLLNGNWQAADQHFHILNLQYWGRIDRFDRITYLRPSRQKLELERPDNSASCCP